MPKHSRRNLWSRLRTIEAARSAEQRFFDLAVEIRRKADGALIAKAGGRWDSWQNCYEGEAEQVIRWTVHAGQAEFIQLNDPHAEDVLVLGGRRSGKSEVGTRRILLEAVRRPGAKLWACSPSFKMGRQLRDKIFRITPKDWVACYSKVERCFHFRNGSRLWLISMDNPDSNRGEDVDLAWLDEAAYMHEEAYTVAKGCLIDRAGQCLLTTTPNGFNWLKEHIYDRQFASDDEAKQTVKVFTFASNENPYIRSERLLTAAKQLDKRTYNQEILAMFEQMAGRIYHNFDRKVHVVTEPDVGDKTADYCEARWGKRYEYVIGMDFNVNPMCAVVLKLFFNKETQVADIVWVVDEHIEHEVSEEEFAEQLKVKGYGPDKAMIICDPSGGWQRAGFQGWKRGAGTSATILRKAGFKVVHREKHPRVRERIHAVLAKLENAEGKQTLFFDPECSKTVKAIEAHIYTAEGEPDKKQGHDHIADALGYAIEYLFPVRMPWVTTKTQQAQEKLRRQLGAPTPKH